MISYKNIRMGAVGLFLASLVVCNVDAASSKGQRRNRKSRSQAKQQQQVIAPHYKPMTFDFSQVTFSSSQLDQHAKLYQGYVNKRNEIESSLEAVDKSNVTNITYSPFRALKTAETFAYNGSILHELYFENLGTNTRMGPQTEQLINDQFGSIDKFKEDLIACASCSRGWVLTSYCFGDGKLRNFVLDAHNETVPVLVIPILVIDIYEHAYMIDYGINRAQYLKDLWLNINWDVVESRVTKWLAKLNC